MAAILFASELGSNLGHLGQILPLAIELRARGHDVLFALRDVARADALLRPNGFRCTQAPVWHGRGARDPPPCSYSEILQHYGYADSAGLLGLVSAWRELYAYVKPGAVVCEYAPTALLASRGLGMTRITYGTGFSSPPRVSPLPNFRTWEDVPADRLAASDRVVLENINLVLRHLHLQPLGDLPELLDAEEDFLCTFSELDHYQTRPNAQYWGPIYLPDEGASAKWPERGNKRVFVYLQPRAAAFEPVAQQLSDLGHSVLWVAPGIRDEIARRFDSPRFTFSRETVRLSGIAAVADAALLHGGHGTTAAMLVGGIPVGLFPQHAEQGIVARNVVTVGAGAVASAGATASEVSELIRRVLHELECRQAAGAFRAKYDPYDPRQVVRNIAERIVRVLTI